MSGGISNIVDFCQQLLPSQAYSIGAKCYRKTLSTISHYNHRKAFRKQSEAPLTIVFLVYLPQCWNSLKSVYRACVNDQRVEAFVIVSPESKDGKLVVDEKAYDYFRSEVPNAINALRDGALFDLKTLEPDYIFRQTPYDHIYPKQYSMKALARYAKTCYVPYNYNFSPKKHLEIEYNRSFMLNLFATFEESLSNYAFCCDLQTSRYPDLNVFNLGFPRMDLLREMKDKRKKTKMVFTWIPRWSLDSSRNDASSFFDYADKLVDFFGRNQNCYLIIRPHPLMFSHFITVGAMSENEIQKYKDTITRLENVELDFSADYIPTFEKTDALIADYSSLIYEFYLTTRPIIYCGSTQEFNSETKTMMELLYKADNWDELEHHICQIIRGIDKFGDERRTDVKRILDSTPNDIGAAIVEQCLSMK